MEKVKEATVELAYGSRRMTLKLNVPEATISADSLLPVARQISNVASAALVEDAARAGTPVSCRAGCGACCRQFVPVTLPEARRLSAMVEQYPEPRRSEIIASCEQARQKVEAAGLMSDVLERSWYSPEAGRLYGGAEYFRLGIPCPFLVEESCSIYDERPLVCREFHVISPPEFCSDPSQGKTEVVQSLALSFQPFSRIATPPGEAVRMTPLFLALEWAARETSPSAHGPGMDLLRRFFQEVAQGAAPESAAGAIDPQNASPNREGSP